VRLPGDDLFLAVTELPVGGVSGAFFIRAKASSGGAVVGEWQLPLRAQLSQEVWVAATRLERGQELERSLLGVQKVDVLRERTPLLPATADPTAFDLTQSVPAGRPLTTRDVVARPVVRKGQVVEVTARQGLLAVTMKALALESGAVGDLIKLRNLESRREFSGQILHESKVQVHF
jgi:flagella basal body P-ring formation protein FlgA